MSYWRFLAALALVIGLIALLAWVARRFPAAGLGIRSGGGRLAVIESLAITPRQRLLLVRIDDREHVVLLGHDHGVVVVTGLEPKAAQTVGSASTGQDE